MSFFLDALETYSETRHADFQDAAFACRLGFHADKRAWATVMAKKRDPHMGKLPATALITRINTLRKKGKGKK